MKCVCGVVAAFALLTGCTSGGSSKGAPVTIATAAEEATVSPTTAPVVTSTTVADTPEEELRAATLAYWAEFRRTALNLETDDLSRLSAWYSSESGAANSLASLRDVKSKGRTYRLNQPDDFIVRVEKVVRLTDAVWAVTSCISDNMVLVEARDGTDKVLDSSISANRFTDEWSRRASRWVIEKVASRQPLSEGVPCA
jgi:hypothetical protein